MAKRTCADIANVAHARICCLRSARAARLPFSDGVASGVSSVLLRSISLSFRSLSDHGVVRACSRSQAAIVRPCSPRVVHHRARTRWRSFAHDSTSAPSVRCTTRCNYGGARVVGYRVQAERRGEACVQSTERWLLVSLDASFSGVGPVADAADPC